MTTKELGIEVESVEIIKNDEGDNMCGICLDDLNCKSESGIIVTLKCKHRYCYECIYDSYLKNKEKRQCPYCRKKGGYLPLPESTTPTKFIHKEYVKSKLPSLPLMYCISHYKKDEFIAIAKKLGISLFNGNHKKKLKAELYHDIKIAYSKDNTIKYKL
jgi:hypothetical protein